MRLGSKHTDETRRKMSESKKGSKNQAWKGDDVQYVAGHERVHKMRPLTGICEHCRANPPSYIVHLPNKKTRTMPGTELHNVSGEYRWEDPSDWIEVCRRCHHHLNRERL
jgi:hypothetical protein